MRSILIAFALMAALLSPATSHAADGPYDDGPDLSQDAPVEDEIDLNRDSLEADLEEEARRDEAADEVMEEEGPQYILDPEVKGVLSWIGIGTGGAALVTGVGLFVAYLAVSAPLYEMAQQQQQEPESSSGNTQTYLQQRQLADGLYIASIATVIPGVVLLAAGVVLTILPDELFEVAPEA